MGKIGFFRKVNRLGNPSRKTLEDITRKLTVVYHECGGEKYKGEDYKGMDPFDVKKVMIAEKIKICRKTMKDIESITQQKAKIIKKSDVRNMIMLIKKDFDSMEKIFIQNSSPKKLLFSKQKIDKKQARRQEEDLELIKNHIKELEALQKLKYQKKRPSASKRIHNLVETDEENEEESEEEDLMGQIVVEDDMDPTQSNLPAIDCTAQLQLVKKKKDVLKEGILEFEKSLDIVAEMAHQMTYKIDEGSRIINDISDKIDKQTNGIEHLNEKTEKAKKKIAGQTKLLILIILIFFLIIGISITYVVLVSTGVFSSPFR